MFAKILWFEKQERKSSNYTHIYNFTLPILCTPRPLLKKTAGRLNKWGYRLLFRFFSYVNKQLILTRFDLTLCHNACKSANKSIWGPFFFINVILKKKKKIIFVKLLFEKICKYQIANFVNIPRSKRRRHHFWLPCLATIPSVSLSFGNLVECQWSPTSARYKKNKLRNNITWKFKVWE